MDGEIVRAIRAHFSAPGYGELPDRVLIRVQAQKEGSEILIGWIQLAVGLVFLLLYTVSPKTFGEEARFAPVPWALGMYFAFTTLRLVLAHARRMPFWLPYLSAVLDMVLLLGLIWSYHLQYEQPASFYLKAPTLLYVFIFIALRALYYERRYLVVSGITAALGWGAMVAYVVMVDPANPMITRNYVEYMTSNSVLLGAEFDKIITIATVTAILALAIARSRRLLVQSVLDSTAARDLSRFLPPQIARQVAESDRELAAGDGEVREASVLFVDMEGFTGVSEGLSPERLIQTLNEYFQAVAGPIEANGGVVNQFQGDAIIASFNLPEAHADHAANAVRAAIEIQEVLRRRHFGEGIELRARVGINSGEVVGGLVGAGDRLSYTVHGDAVNLAARLEQLNKSYGSRILVSARTRELAGAERFRFREAGEVQLRGRTGNTHVYVVEDSASPIAAA
jgi:adenylate cyclase